MGKWVGLALVFAAGLVIAAVAGAADTKLTGVVGPGFTISLVDAQGQSVTRLPAGEVDITVDDRGNEHNFHLRGPGVDFSTGVEEVGQRTFTVTLRDGNYTFVCDPHAGQMAGAFQAGTGGTTTPPPTTSPPPTTHDAVAHASRRVRAGRLDAEPHRRPGLHDLAPDARGEEGDRAAARQLHRRRARPVERPQRAAARGRAPRRPPASGSSGRGPGASRCGTASSSSSATRTRRACEPPSASSSRRPSYR